MNAAVQSRWNYNVVDDAKAVEKTVEEICSTGNDIISLGLRTFNSRVSVVLIGAWDNEKRRGVVYIFDAVKMKGIHQVNCILTSADIIKVTHDSRDMNVHLETQFNLRLVNVFDIQVAYSVIKSQRDGQRTDQVDDISLNDLCAEYGVLRNPITETLQQELQTDPAQWRRRPFTNAMKELALIDTLVLVPLYIHMNPLLNDRSVFDRLTAKHLNPEENSVVAEEHPVEVEVEVRVGGKKKKESEQTEVKVVVERGNEKRRTTSEVDQRIKKAVTASHVGMQMPSL